MKDSLVNKLANHFVECFKIRANTDYTSNAPSNAADSNSVNDLRTDVVEEATDMLFMPSFRKETDSMTDEQYRKYIKKVQEDTKSVKYHDPKDSPVENPEIDQDSYTGIPTNS